MELEIIIMHLKKSIYHEKKAEATSNIDTTFENLSNLEKKVIISFKVGQEDRIWLGTNVSEKQWYLCQG